LIKTSWKRRLAAMRVLSAIYADLPASFKPLRSSPKSFELTGAALERYPITSSAACCARAPPVARWLRC
jgi:hypothetical protein